MPESINRTFAYLQSLAQRALVPLKNKRTFLEVSGNVKERAEPIFFADPVTAAMKALGMTLRRI
jgi:ATP-dependent Lon protease